MTVVILAFLGGVLTILSPCILPVLPFVFARADQPFRRSTLPLLIGMAATFAAVATLAAVGGAWAVRVNDYGRIVAIVLLGSSGVALLSKRVGDWLTRPFVAMGNRLLSSGAEQPGTGAGAVGRSLLLGVATGFLWAPCAGPILGLILTGAALNGPSAQTTLLLLAYSLGAMTSMAIAALAGGRVFTAMKRSLGAGEWIRRGLGIAVLLAVVVIGLGWDTGFLTSLSSASTNRIEQSLINVIRPKANASPAATSGSAALPVEGTLPSLDGASAWLNSVPLTADSLRGKVVLVDFWTYSCINCLRSLPYVKSWYARYKDQGLVVIGVHTPEFAFEKSVANVQKAMRDLGVAYPVAVDSNYAIWKAFNNEYWPAHYFIDAQGRIRGHHFGEGDYDESEQLIRRLLTEAGKQALPVAASETRAGGIQAAADLNDIGSEETYVGFERAANFASPGGFSAGVVKIYRFPPQLGGNNWALAGAWRVEGERAVTTAPGAGIEFRFHARDLHLVMGPGSAGKPLRFRVSLDGKPPGESHGVDTDAAGMGVIRDQRLYQLIRQAGAVGDHTFTIEFLDAGAEAYAFTFG